MIKNVFNAFAVWIFTVLQSYSLKTIKLYYGSRQENFRSPYVYVVLVYGNQFYESIPIWRFFATHGVK